MIDSLRRESTKMWMLRMTVLVLFFGLLAVPFLFRGGVEASGIAERSVIILTPHNEQIRYEFGRAFSRWHEKNFGEPIRVEWRIPGGTSDIRRMLEAQFQGALRDGTALGGAADLLFGGGQFEHDQLKAGVSVSVGEERRHASVSEPVRFSEAELLHAVGSSTLEAVYEGTQIAGNLLFDPDGYWFGTALSGFGIVYNRDALAQLGVSSPEHWRDLTHPALAGWVALGNPAQSGSIRKSFDTVLQHRGWNDGWRILRRTAANSRYFATSSSKVPVDVSQGDAAVGVCIDFYGRFQSQAVADTGDADRLGYIDPAGESAIDADPISILKGAPNRETARRFILFCLTREAQALWQFRRDDPNPDGLGPERFELRRLPIRRMMYEEYFDRFVDRANPYEFARPFENFNSSYWSFVSLVFTSMAVENHVHLRRAWEAITRHPAFPRDNGMVGADEVSDPVLRAMITRFDAMPSVPGPADTSYAISDESVLPEIQSGWLRGGWSEMGLWRPEIGPETTLRQRLAGFFRANYEMVVELADESRTGRRTAE